MQQALRAAWGGHHWYTVFTRLPMVFIHTPRTLLPCSQQVSSQHTVQAGVGVSQASVWTGCWVSTVDSIGSSTWPKPCGRHACHSYAPLQVTSGCNHHTKQKCMAHSHSVRKHDQHFCCQPFSLRASSCPTLLLFLQQQYGDDPCGNKHPGVQAQ